MKDKLENVKLDDHPFGGHDIDASSLGWVMSAVSSRAFRLYGSKRPDGTHIETPMLLPLIDMCNHNFMPNAEIVQEKESCNENMIIKVCSVSYSSIKFVTLRFVHLSPLFCFNSCCSVSAR